MTKTTVWPHGTIQVIRELAGDNVSIKEWAFTTFTDGHIHRERSRIIGKLREPIARTKWVENMKRSGWTLYDPSTTGRTTTRTV